MKLSFFDDNDNDDDALIECKRCVIWCVLFSSVIADNK